MQLRPKPDIRAVFFDIGNVLLHFNVAEIAKKMAWTVRRRPLQVGRYLWHSKIGARIERGDISGRELFRKFKKDLDFEGDFAAFRLVWCDHFHLDRGVEGLLKEVAAQRPVYLLSNTNHLHYEFFKERYSFPGYVRGALLSYRLKLRKPDERIYHAAVRRARIRPENGLFIDDLAANVEGARKIGLNAVQFVDAAALRRDLKRFGVL